MEIDQLRIETAEERVARLVSIGFYTFAKMYTSHVIFPTPPLLPVKEVEDFLTIISNLHFRMAFEDLVALSPDRASVNGWRPPLLAPVRLRAGFLHGIHVFHCPIPQRVQDWQQ